MPDFPSLTHKTNVALPCHEMVNVSRFRWQCNRDATKSNQRIPKVDSQTKFWRNSRFGKVRQIDVKSFILFY